MESNVLTLKNIAEKSYSLFKDRPALGFSDEAPLSYAKVQNEVKDLQKQLMGLGISKGDRVAVLSQNMPNWGIAYLAVTTMGAVAVPILPDFSGDEVKNILEHSGTRGIFVSERMQNKITEISIQMEFIFLLDDLSRLKGEPKQDILNSGSQASWDVLESDLASVIYTSGTTGRSKGVMLSHKNIAFNATKVLTIQAVNSEDVFLSVLPLSHTYENTLGFILPFMQGAVVYYLKKPPTAAVLLPALKEIRPTTMLTVPMIMEKIYRNQVLVKFTSNSIMSFLYGISFIRKFLHRLAGKKLMKTFGGRLRFYGIGGAKLDPMVERFLSEAGFPYAIGYGLTETAPLLAGANPAKTVYQATGPAMEGVQLRIDHPDPVTGIGEIQAKGDNVMLGYFNEPELTKEVFSADGWFKTGDLGCFDKASNLFIKGRLKNMILSSTGENIYPEDIESVINNHRYVLESLVIEKKGKLVALVHVDYESLMKHFGHVKEEMGQMKDDAMSYLSDKIELVQSELIEYVNNRVNKYSRVQAIVLMQQPFEKTPTLKIKRYLYA